MTYATLDHPAEGVGVLTLAREDRLNSLSFDLVVLLVERLNEAIGDRSIECIILTGKGRAFCSGADVQDSEPPPDIDGLTMNQIATKAMDILVGLIRTMRHAPKPIICHQRAGHRWRTVPRPGHRYSASGRIGLLPSSSRAASRTRSIWNPPRSCSCG